MIAATLLICFTCLSTFLHNFRIKSNSGLFIHPVIDTPSNASRSKIFLLASVRNGKSVNQLAAYLEQLPGFAHPHRTLLRCCTCYHSIQLGYNPANHFHHLLKLVISQFPHLTQFVPNTFQIVRWTIAYYFNIALLA